MKERLNRIFLWVFILAYVFYFSLVSFLKFRSFGFYDFDLAVHSLTVWNILHGSIYNSILGIPFLGNHVQLILFFVAPIYALFSHPLNLLFLQSAALGLAALPLYNLAKKILNTNWALIISVVYLMYPALGYVNLFEFHPTVFATLFLISAFHYYEQKSFVKFLVFAALSLFCQENIPLAMIMFGALAAFNRRSLKWIITPIVGGFLYLIFAWYLMQYFNNNTVQFIGIYGYLGRTPFEIISNCCVHPVFLLKILTRKACLVYLLQLFIPLCFLPLLRPLYLLPALPFFLQHMLSIRGAEINIFRHYTAEMIPFIFISYIYAIKFLLDKQLKVRPALLKSFLLTVIISSNLYFGPHFGIFSRLSDKYKVDYLDGYKSAFVNKIPGTCPVVATFEFLPHLASRSFLYSFHHVYSGFYTLSDKKYILPEDTQYALIDFNDSLTFSGFYNDSNYKNLRAFLSQGSWGVQDFIETIVLFKKNISSGISICRALDNPAQEIKNKTAINVEDEVALIGYNMTLPDKEGVLGITFYWKSLRPTKKDINIFLDIVDKEDRLLMRKNRPICYRIFPTNSWKIGDIFKEQCRIWVPEQGRKLKIGFFDFGTGRLCSIAGSIPGAQSVFLGDIR